MKIFNKVLIFFCSLFITTVAFAFDNSGNSTLVLTLINNSSEILNYTGATKTNPGSAFSVMPTEIFPGGAATITCTNMPYADLAGQLHFSDSSNNGNLLTIVDKRLIHYSQPVFSMHNDLFISFVESKTFNVDGKDDPRALSYIAATVIIEKNIGTKSANT